MANANIRYYWLIFQYNLTALVFIKCRVTSLDTMSPSAISEFHGFNTVIIYWLYISDPRRHHDN